MGSFVESVDLNALEIPLEVIKKIPAKFANHYKIIPFEHKNGILTLASKDPLNINIIDTIRLFTKMRVNLVFAQEKEIMDAIKKYYGIGAETIDTLMEKLNNNIAQEINIENEIISETSISSFLNQIFSEAYHARSTDIHIEPYEDELKIRYRVDGILNDAKVPKNIKHFKDEINSRIKILSNLNIAEKRSPQDGRFKLKIFGELDLDLRVSFMPTAFGESVVIRILNSAKLYNFRELGLDQNEQKKIENLINKPHGIIFLAGPTGSGKTTTLYSCLKKIHTEEKKIVTIEDPVEYQIKNITQIQVNPSIGLTFTKILRSVLRHDPDIMMIGEVRDAETAQIATQIALTGHLIFSTLHTNDSSSGITRLLDMGIEPYLIASTVESFISQRLVRKLCVHCKKKSKDKYDSGKERISFYEAVGCEKCGFKGYIGRQAIYEILLINDVIRELIMKKESADIIKSKAVEYGMKTLFESGIEKIKSGITSPQEIIRVNQQNC